MARDRWDRLQASNSFTAEEVEAMKTLFAAYRRGGDLHAYFKSAAAQRVAAKFIRMSQRIELIRTQRAGKPRPTREEVLDALYDAQRPGEGHREKIP